MTLRMQAVQSPIIPIITELIANHPGTISFGQGVVHYGPPPEAIAGIQTFLADVNNNRYRPVQGLPELVTAISGKLMAENGIEHAREQIIVTAGGNQAFANAVLAISDFGDEFILLSPFYFNHDMAIASAGCRTVAVPTKFNYQPSLDNIAAAITDRTCAVVTVSPNNPTGAVYSRETLTAINELCRERGIYHIHDEAYEYFTYGDAEHFSPASIPGSEPYTISLFSLSKAYGFASWRIGYMVTPKDLVSDVKKIHDTYLICAPVISQFAAVGALHAGREYCRAGLCEIAAVRKLALEALAPLSEYCIAPAAEGAFYLLLECRTSLSPMQVAKRLIVEHGVAVLPGTTFGVSDRCLLRVSYGALKLNTALEGVARLVAGLQATLSGG